MFDGLETEWEEAGVLLQAEAVWETPIGGWMVDAAPRLAGLLRFGFLTTGEDTETNNVGASTTELRVGWPLLAPARGPLFVPLVPDRDGKPRAHLGSRLVPAGAAGAERRDRSTSRSFATGPHPGARIAWEPASPWSVGLGYRHAFLIGVQVSNTFAETLGFGDLETNGQRDVVDFGVARRFGSRWSARLGYRFEVARIEASRTASRIVNGATGPQRIEVQFPENDHRIHAALLSASFRF